MYTYEQMIYELSALPIYSAGSSRMGRSLVYTELGGGTGGIFINGAHHGLESITAMLCVRFAHFLQREKPARRVVIMPMVNPDGVTIAENRIPEGTQEHEFLVSLNGGTDFSGSWQANAAGVDLNHNYDAAWRQIYMPGPTRCSGTAPLSEPETRAVTEFIDREQFDMVICLHSQGEVIYQGFGSKLPKDSDFWAQKMAQASGYAVETASGLAGFGGLKDWFVDKYNRPGYTIEVGKGKNPLPLCCATHIARKLFPALLLTCRLKE